MDILKIGLWRHKQGYDVTVVPTSESGSSENAINVYINDAYSTWQNPPEIVSLVGDVGGSYNIACDYYEWGSGWYSYEGASDVDILILLETTCCLKLLLEEYLLIAVVI